MSLFLCISLTILSFWIQNHECAENPQIKVVRINVTYVNPEYINGLNESLEKHNETYNDIRLNHVELLQDFPQDSFLHSKVYVTDKDGNKEQLLFESEISLCQENVLHDLLPLYLCLDVSLLGKRCFQKGVYVVKDKGQLRFDILISNVETIGKYFTAYYDISTPREQIVSFIFYSQWGYLKE